MKSGIKMEIRAKNIDTSPVYFSGNSKAWNIRLELK